MVEREWKGAKGGAAAQTPLGSVHGAQRRRGYLGRASEEAGAGMDAKSRPEGVEPTPWGEDGAGVVRQEEAMD